MHVLKSNEVPSELPVSPAQMPRNLLERLSPVVLEIYAAGDFHRADMRTIARDSGTSFRTIYKYFRDKEHLLFWFINHWLTDLYPQAFAPLDEPGPLHGRLQRVLARHFEYYEAHPDVGRIIFMTVPLAQWMKDSSYAQTEMMSRLLEAIKAAQACGELRRDVPPVALLDSFNAIFNRTFLMWEYRGRKQRLKTQGEYAFEILWRGVGS